MVHGNVKEKIGKLQVIAKKDKFQKENVDHF
jgi:hypothetical protein